MMMMMMMIMIYINVLIDSFNCMRRVLFVNLQEENPTKYSVDIFIICDYYCVSFVNFVVVFYISYRFVARN